MMTKKENDLAAYGWVRRNFTKDCVDTNVEITGIINLVI